MKNIIFLIISFIGLFTGCSDNTYSANIYSSSVNNSIPYTNTSEFEDVENTIQPDVTDIYLNREDYADVSNIQYDKLLYNENHPEVIFEASSSEVIEIKEKMFIAQTNDIYFNPEDYLGKTIKYEGIFNMYDYPGTNELLYSVIRYGPGCCGIDLNAGFEIVPGKEVPNNEDWVEVTGVLHEYEFEGVKYLRLEETSLRTLPTHGEKYVFQ